MAYPPTIPSIYKDPLAVLDFGFDLAKGDKPWLADSEQVTTLNVIPDAGITVNNKSIGPNASGVDAALIVAWIAGGTAGTTYNVKFEFTTNEGRTDARSISLIVAQR